MTYKEHLIIVATNWRGIIRGFAGLAIIRFDIVQY